MTSLRAWPCISSIKNIFYYSKWCTLLQNHRNVKKIYKFKIAPTCFGSRRNYHQGAVLCLAKTTKYFFCARRYRRSQCYKSACCAGVRWTALLHSRLICRHNIDCVYTDEHRKKHFVVLDKHRTAPWWWFLREQKHVGASIIILKCLNISMIL